MRKMKVSEAEEIIKSKFPEYRIIKSIDEGKDGEKAAIKAKVVYQGMPLIPSVKFIKNLDDKIEEIDYSNSIAGISFLIKNGVLYLIENKLKEKNNFIEDINFVISIFNILGIPFDYAKYDKTVLLVEDSKGNRFEMNLSKKAKRIQSIDEFLEIDPNEKMVIDDFFKIIDKRIDKLKLYELIDTIKLFGYSNCYLFHSNIHLTFINSWIFIESYINYLWKRSINVKYDGLKYKPENKSRNWTIQIKIENLFLMNEIKPYTRELLHKYRKKRNNVFHFDDNPQKRKVQFTDSIECFQLARLLFFKMLGFEEGEILQSKIMNELHNKFGLLEYGEGWKYNSKSI